jgi:3-hydroxyisobutyrate dehydrogenase
MRVGYLGLGSMGAPMARNLADAGHDLLVYDLDKSRVEDLTRNGARAADSGEQLAGEVDVLFTSLPGPRQSAAAMPGLIAALPTGATWVDMTTNDRELVLELARRAETRGISVLDAPVTGAVDGARRGELTIFVGGALQTVEHVRPLLEAMGRIIVCGDIGTGNVVKLVTNQIWFINAAAIGEGKDLGLIEKLSQATQTQTPATMSAQARFEAARKAFGGDQAELLVCKLIEDAAGVDLRVEGDWPKHSEA